MVEKRDGGSKNLASHGPDLNASRGPLDKKVYRQILLPNGLRAVLVSDVAAMNQMQSEGETLLGDEEESQEGDEKNSTSQNPTTDKTENKEPEADEPKSRTEDGSDGEHSEEGGAEASWLRDAAAAIRVGVGSFSDPPECQGLAHFLEHLLFLGSEKYPVENDFDAFMSKHGGEENAFTESETTTYHFSIPQEYLSGALDRIAQFFISPLLLKSGVERELQAIESEYQLNKQSDHARLVQLWSTTCGNPDHPFSRFQWGNTKSLKEIPEKEGVDPMVHLRSFYDKYYYGLNIRVVVVGAYTLDDLQEHVVRCFSDVPKLPRDGSIPDDPNNPQTSISWESLYESPIKKYGPPMAESSFMLYRIVPVKDRHNLSMTWQLPPQFGRWKSKPMDYISHLLGHEAQGSLLSALKKKNWVTTCVAGCGGDELENSSSHALFSMTFTLSMEGVDHWPEIISELYSYIGMLRHFGPNLPEWIYQELRQLHDLAYRFADEPAPQDLCENIVEDMSPHLNLPPERLLDGNELLFEFDAEEIQDLLIHFNPKNARIDFMSSRFGSVSGFDDCTPDDSEPPRILQPSVKFDREKAGMARREPWFGTYYWPERLDPKMLEVWSGKCSPSMPLPSSKINLPTPNPFVPSQLEIKPTPPDDSDHPLLNCCLKLCIVIGKKKQWLPATVTKFNSINNEVLVSYEDEDEKWHKVDHQPGEISRTCDAEGTLDGKKVKFRVISVPKEGEGAVRKFGDDSDFNVLDGVQFPPIPPAKAPSRLPKLVHTSQMMKFWHLQDRDFLRPIAELRLAVFSSRVNDSALHRACAELIVQLCHDALTETVYLASLGELGSSIESSENGFGFRIHGFNDKLMSLFEIVFKQFLSFRGRTALDGLPEGIENARFDACMEMLQRKYKNSGMEALTMASSIRVRCICPGSWSAWQKAEALDGLEMATFVEIASLVLENVSLEAFYHGNIDLPEAKMVAELIEGMVTTSGCGALPRKKLFYQFVSKLPLSDKPVLVCAPSKDLESSNTAIEVYFQVGKDSLAERVLIDMLVHLMEEPLYTQLRTKESYGYRVSCDSRWSVGVMGIKFIVVTASKSAAATAERLENFLIDFRTELVNMKPCFFMENLVALAKGKLDMFNSLAELSSSYWAEIRDCRYHFEVNRNEALALRNVTKEAVLDAFDKWLLPSSKRRMMVVQVICATQQQENGETTDASMGRPEVDPSQVAVYCDGLVDDFHKTCKHQTWGKIFT